MRRLATVLVGLLLATQLSSRAESAPTDEVARRADAPALACDASRDERIALAADLATNGALAGRTLVLPSGCRILLGSPGAGNAALTLASNTRIRCADASAGFVLARQSCRGGSLPGAACDPAQHDADCPGGGRCTADGSSGPFAPETGGSYGVIAAEKGSIGTGVSDCSIWVNGVSGDSIADGGSGRRYGYCSGGKGDGYSCSSTCSRESGLLAGFACTRDADCGSGAGVRCQSADGCTALGGTCGPPPLETPWGPSGKGRINPIDLRNSTGASVDRVTIHDHRRGAFAIAIGSALRKVERADVDRQLNAASLGPSTVQGSTTNAATTWVTPVGILFAEVYDPRPFVDIGIIGGDGSIVRDNRVAASRFGIRAASSSTVSGNFVTLPTTLVAGASALDSSPAGERLPRGVGLLASGNDTVFAGNHVEAYIGFLAEPERGFNVTVADNRFFNGSGPKVAIPAGAGIIVTGNYMAWGSSENLDCTANGRPWSCCLGPGSGTCTGPGVVRIGSSAAEARAGRTDHVDLVGNLLHSNQPYATYVAFEDSGRRCVKGDRPYEACTADADCPDVASCTASGDPRPCCSGAGAGSCLSSCRATSYANSFISDNHFHSGTAKQTAIDFSHLTSGSTVVSGMTVVGNRIARFGRGIVFPSDPRSIQRANFLANDFSETASAAAVCLGVATPFPCCTGAGTGTCAVYEGWAWSSGERRGDSGLTLHDDQPTIVSLPSAAGAEIRSGDAVVIARGGSAARAGRGAAVAGIALVAGPPDGGPITIATSGVAPCRVSASVEPGQTLGPGDAPGELSPTDDGHRVAVALTAGVRGQLVRCLVSGR